MPIVQIELIEGRSEDQKREMAKQITETISQVAKTPKENVKIIFREMTTTNYAQGGKLTKDIINEKK